MPGEISTTTVTTQDHIDTITLKSKPEQTGTTAQAAAAVQTPTNGSHSISSILHATLAKQPPKVVSAEGNYLITASGTRIFDATGGAAVACLGHGHPRAKQAIVDQLDSVEYTYSPFFTTSASENLASHLTESTGGEMSKVFVVSSGTEAVEAGLKLARQYFIEKGEPERTNFIARHQSYHGNTLGSLAVGGHKARKAIYEPLLSENVSHVNPPYPYRGMKDGESEEAYVERLGQELEDEFQRVGPGKVCAFVAETMSGLVSERTSPSPRASMLMTFADPRRHPSTTRLPLHHQVRLHPPRCPPHPRRSHVGHGPHRYPPRLATRLRNPTPTNRRQRPGRWLSTDRRFART